MASNLRQRLELAFNRIAVARDHLQNEAYTISNIRDRVLRAIDIADRGEVGQGDLDRAAEVARLAEAVERAIAGLDQATREWEATTPAVLKWLGTVA